MSFDQGLKTIVVATGLDGQAEAALEYARKLAVNYKARIVLAHGLDPLEYVAVDGLPGSVVSHLDAEARKVLDKLAGELLREGIHSHSEVRQGAVAGMLVDVARQYDAGLIVIGTKGQGGAGPVVVGAIAEQLVRLAPCPVLAVAADWNAGKNRPAPGGPVLLAVESNDAATVAAATAYSLAVTFSRPLLLLHVRTEAEIRAGKDPCAATPKDFGVKLPPRPHHARSGGSGWLLNEAPVHCIVKDGDPREAIEEAIAECHPCILVAGVKRVSGTGGPHGTAFALLSTSRVPVLCVPPETRRVDVEELIALPVGAP
ncbi:MAG TPA: universal stress protein [Terracidiphilus sp.]|jgi:nucleotide-binding universal stress UspA family protein